MWKSLQLFYDGLYLEEIKIDNKKYYSVIQDRKLLIYTSSKRSALNILNKHKKNNQSDSA